MIGSGTGVKDFLVLAQALKVTTRPRALAAPGGNRGPGAHAVSQRNLLRPALVARCSCARTDRPLAPLALTAKLSAPTALALEISSHSHSPTLAKVLVLAQAWKQRTHD